MPRENAYQKHVIKKLERVFRGCFIIKLPTDLIQGLPDILVLFGNRWAMLEIKAYVTAPFQPNQMYYIHLFDEMSFAAIICPENEEEVFRALQYAFES